MSHRSAAFVLGVPLPEPEVVELITGRGSHVRRSGVLAHEPTDRLDLRPVMKGGLPVANPLRVLLDLGANGTAAEVELALEHFLVEGAVSVRSVAAALERHRSSGRTGLVALRSILAEHRFGTKPPDSVLEIAGLRLVRKFGLPAPQFHHQVLLGGRSIEVDFAWPGHMVILEVDGWAYHSGRTQTEEDRERDLLLAGAGWLPLRATWLKVTRRPAWVAAQVQRTLQQRRIAA